MKRYYLYVLLVMLLTGCGKAPVEDARPQAPEMLGVELTGIVRDGDSYDADVVLSFDQNIKCLSSNLKELNLAPSGEIVKLAAYDANLTVSVQKLELGVNYTLTIPTGVVSGFRDNPCSELKYSFSKTFTSSPTPGDYALNPANSLTDAKASAEATALYSYLCSNYGKAMMSGVQSEVGNHKEGQFAESIRTASGKYPAIQGFDYIFQQWGETNWTSIAEITAAAEDHWKKGGIVAMSWHWNVPNSEADINDPAKYHFYLKENDKTSSTFDIREALKEGTWQNRFILNDIDRLAANMRQLADKDIPILWRPLHEAAGDFTWGAWFWWGAHGVEATAELWRLMYDRLVNVNGIHNLIWVWTFQTCDQGRLASLDKIAASYPGNDYVDIVGVDLYEGNHSLFNRPDVFKAINSIVKGGKIVALTECGNLPNVDKCFSDGEPWSWFMSWTDSGFAGWNSLAIWKEIMNNKNVINRGVEIPVK